MHDLARHVTSMMDLQNRFRPRDASRQNDKSHGLTDGINAEEEHVKGVEAF